MKKFLKWAVIIIVVPNLLYIIWLLIFDIDKLGFKKNIYENSRYGFSLEYPSNWTPGEQTANNIGQEFFSPDDEVFCYAYGFENTLLTTS